MHTLNVSHNEMLTGERFFNLDRFLAVNRSCTTLNLSDCGLGKSEMQFVGLGISKNSTLQKLILSSNVFDEPACLKYLCEGLNNNKAGSKLVELDLQRCSLSSESIDPLVLLVARKYKLRILNLRDNGISDEGASAFLSALKLNPYLTKVSMELNPARLHIVRDIEAYAKQNN